MSNREIKFINIVLCFFMLACLGNLAAQNNYAQTALQLEQKLSEEPLSGLEYYNLGTAYAKMDSLARARLYLEKAQLLLPWNKNIKQNIRWVRTELATEIAIIPEFFLTRIWKKMALTLSPLSWQILGVFILIITLAASFYIIYLNPNRKGTWSWTMIFGISLLAFSCFGFSSTASGHLYGQKRCVLMESAGGLKEAPEKSSVSLSALIGGTLVEVLEELGEWNRVKLEDGSIGWIEKKYVKNLSFDPTKTQL